MVVPLNWDRYAGEDPHDGKRGRARLPFLRLDFAYPRFVKFSTTQPVIRAWFLVTFSKFTYDYTPRSSYCIRLEGARRLVETVNHGTAPASRLSDFASLQVWRHPSALRWVRFRHVFSIGDLKYKKSAAFSHRSDPESFRSNNNVDCERFASDDDASCRKDVCSKNGNLLQSYFRKLHLPVRPPRRGPHRLAPSTSPEPDQGTCSDATTMTAFSLQPVTLHICLLLPWILHLLHWDSNLMLEISVKPSEVESFQ